MKVKIEEIRKILTRILVKNGLPLSQAKLVANEYLEGELQGKHSHGINFFPAIVKMVPRQIKPIKILKKTSSVISADAQKNFGAVVGIELSNKAVRMAKSQGVATIMIRNMRSWMRPGTIARHIAEKGFIGIVFNDGGRPIMTAPGSYQRIMGTNPVGIGIPTSGDPIVIDMATSKRAAREIDLAKLAKRKLPANTYLDKQGNFTLDPNKAHSIIPFGDYKGFSLALLIEILCGSLVNMNMGLAKDKGKEPHETLRGGFILIINPGFSTSLKNFKSKNSKLISEIKNLAKMKGVQKIIIPGQRSSQARKQNLTKGSLEVKDELWQKLLELGSN